MNVSVVVDSPIGPLSVRVDDAGRLCGLDFGARSGCSDPAGATLGVQRQLAEYFAGERKAFDLPIAWPRGTAFQIAVWEQLRRIPYGETRSYGQIAAAIGRPSACRAVGAANGANPIAIVVPCHRVIGAGGGLTGFGGGLPIKRALLDLERSPARLPSLV